jgi:hypothetical protein
MRKYIDIIREAAEEQTQTLPEIIQRVRARYNEEGITTREIGNGWCENFAEDVMDIWQGDGWQHREGQDDWQTVETLNFCVQNEHQDVEDWDWALLENHWGITPPQGVPHEVLQRVAENEPNHIWIAYQRKHYDAESPEGVASFFELGFFQRWIKAIGEDMATNPSPSSATE